jgi:hypothetical protein
VGPATGGERAERDHWLCYSGGVTARRSKRRQRPVSPHPDGLDDMEILPLMYSIRGGRA